MHFGKEFLHEGCERESMQSEGLPSEADFSVTLSHLPLPTFPVIS